MNTVHVGHTREGTEASSASGAGVSAGGSLLQVSPGPYMEQKESTA